MTKVGTGNPVGVTEKLGEAADKLLYATFLYYLFTSHRLLLVSPLKYVFITVLLVKFVFYYASNNIQAMNVSGLLILNSLNYDITGRN